MATPQQKALVAWLEKNGGYVHPDLDLFSLSAPELSKDRGVRALKKIPAGDQLLLVPKSLCIMVKDETAQGQLELVRSLKLSPFLSAVLLLMAYRAQGAECEFAPYIDSLPRHHDCLLGWSEEEKAELQGTDLEGRESAAAVFEREVAPLLAAHPKAWPPGTCGLAEFEHACAMVQSRAFHLVKENWITAVESSGTDLYMIPGIDMLNHATQPAKRSTKLALVDAPLTVQCGEPLREVTMQGYFTMKADRDIEAGEQVLHTYGDLSDAQLLQTYGFVEGWPEGEENPHNVAFIPADLLVEACGAIAKAAGLEEVGDTAGGGKGSGSSGKGRKRKAQQGEQQEGASSGGSSAAARRALLERLGLLPPNMVVVAPQQPLSEELLTVAQVMLMPPGDFLEYAQEFEGQQGSSDSATGEQTVRGVLGRAYLDDPDYREAVCFAVLRAVQGALKRYGSTAAEDEALLRQQGAAALDWRAACAVRVRLGEKQLLGRLKGAVMALLSEGSGGSRSEGGSSEDDEDDEDELGSDSELGSGSSGSGDSDSEGSEGESESASEGSKGARGGSRRGAKRQRRRR